MATAGWDGVVGQEVGGDPFSFLGDLVANHLPVTSPQMPCLSPYLENSPQPTNHELSLTPVLTTYWLQPSGVDRLPGFTDSVERTAGDRQALQQVAASPVAAYEVFMRDRQNPEQPACLTAAICDVGSRPFSSRELERGFGDLGESSCAPEGADMMILPPPPPYSDIERCQVDLCKFEHSSVPVTDMIPKEVFTPILHRPLLHDVATVYEALHGFDVGCQTVQFNCSNDSSRDVLAPPSEFSDYQIERTKRSSSPCCVACSGAVNNPGVKKAQLTDHRQNPVAFDNLVAAVGNVKPTLEKTDHERRMAFMAAAPEPTKVGVSSPSAKHQNTLYSLPVIDRRTTTPAVVMRPHFVPKMPTFCGEQDVETPTRFLMLLVRYARTLRYDCQHVLDAVLPNVFVGPAEMWWRYWASRGGFHSWEHFIKSFYDRFVPPGYYEKLRREMEDRCQSAQEDLPTFTYIINDYYDQLGGTAPDEDRIQRIIDNARPEYAPYLVFVNIDNMDDFEQFALKIQRKFEKMSEYKPPTKTKYVAQVDAPNSKASVSSSGVNKTTMTEPTLPTFRNSTRPFVNRNEGQWSSQWNSRTTTSRNEQGHNRYRDVESSVPTRGQPTQRNFPNSRIFQNSSNATHSRGPPCPRVNVEREMVPKETNDAPTQPRTCFICKSEEHLSFNCPQRSDNRNPSNTGRSGPHRTCFFCQSPDHMSFNCPQRTVLSATESTGQRRQPPNFQRQRQMPPLPAASRQQQH